jgi:hypothetical protein
VTLESSDIVSRDRLPDVRIRAYSRIFFIEKVGKGHLQHAHERKKVNHQNPRAAASNERIMTGSYERKKATSEERKTRL